MDRINELEFIHRVYLPNKRPHEKGFVYSCPFCSDRKRRAYMLIDHEKVVCYCHNCSTSVSLKTYIEKTDPILYEEYVATEKEEFIQNLKDGKILSKKSLHHSPPSCHIKDLKLFKLNTKSFIPATDNEDCISYCKARKIPESVVSTLKYCVNEKLPSYGHLVFPCYWSDNEHVYAFQSRSLTQKRFHIHSKNESFKVSGIFQADLSKPVYVFESIIDSYCIDNSIAIMGADLSRQVLDMIKHPVFCFDNDKTGIEKAQKYAQAGFKVLVWESGIKAKDTNELMVKYNWNRQAITSMIQSNIFEGLSAITRLKMKLRNRKK